MRYDIIGDIHGHAEALKALLSSLGYSHQRGAWRHGERQAVFVGDFVDRGPAQVETIDLVRRMIEEGAAQAVMGNHEFNAIAWYLEDPTTPGEHLRRHTAKNRHQHARFLEEVEGSPQHGELIDWMLELPLWLEFDDFRVVHACWHQGMMDYLSPKLTNGNRVSRELMLLATKNDQGKVTEGKLCVFNAVETLLKGMEISLPTNHSFLDKDGHTRQEVRTRWWMPSANTYPAAALMNSDDETRQLPATKIPAHALFWDDAGKPVFVGHYWLTGQPAKQTERVAIVDYSIGKDGKLVAYRFDGERTLDNSKFLWV